MANEKKSEGYTQKPTVEVIESNEVNQHDLFTIVNHNGEFMIALGNQMVSKEKFDSYEKAAHYVDCKPWELIFNSTAVMIKRLQELEQQTSK